MPSVWIQWRASGAGPCAVRIEGFAGNPCRVDTSAKAVSAASRLRRATRRVCLAGWGGGRGWSSPIVLGQSPLTGPAPFLPVSPWNPRVLPQLGTPRWHFLAVVWVDIAQVAPLRLAWAPGSGPVCRATTCTVSLSSAQQHWAQPGPLLPVSISRTFSSSQFKTPS